MLPPDASADRKAYCREIDRAKAQHDARHALRELIKLLCAVGAALLLVASAL